MPKQEDQLKVAIVHDYLREYGGAEKVVEAIHHLYPRAPLYTSYYLPLTMPDYFRQWPIRTSFIQSLPRLNKFFLSRCYVYLYPFALRKFDFSSFGLVISSTAGIAKWINVQPNIPHICYCHQVPKFLYDPDHSSTRDSAAAIRLAAFLSSPLNTLLRMLDQHYAKRVDYFVANSRFTAAHISRIYGRTAEVIHPSVDVSTIAQKSNLYRGVIDNDYYVAVGKLTTVKEFKLAIEACSSVGVKLKIVGEPGPAASSLYRKRSSYIEFLGRVSDDELFKLLANCRALLSTGVEDFGIAAVEALATGRPVIARKFSGSAEIIEDGVTGRLFDTRQGKSLEKILKEFRPEEFNEEVCRQQAATFDHSRFNDRFEQFVHEKLREFRDLRDSFRHLIERFDTRATISPPKQVP